jgi:Leucine-rich repeat (LRR) protein
LNDNQLSGSLSTAIGDLSSLTFLQIDNNQFTSTIPSEMGQLSGLSKYIVFHCSTFDLSLMCVCVTHQIHY